MKNFNIYNFASEDSFRPAMNGVFYDGGYKVASDCIVLAAVKSDYPDALEHHVVDSEGKDILAKYPNWRQVIPSGPDYKPYCIDTAQFEAFLKERRAAWKASMGKGTRWGNHKWNVQIGPALFRARKFETFLSGMKEIGATEIFVMDGRRTAYAKTDKGWMLIFPVREENGEEKDTVKLA